MAGTVASNGALPSLGKLATHGRPDYWTTLGRIQSGMVLDFTSASIADALAAYGFAFARASTATRFTSSGVMETVSSGAMRIDHDPVTLACLGYLCEEQSVNAIRNSTMVGVAAGSPGTLPTNWSTSDAGLTRTVTVVTSEDGVPCVDIRWSGTASSTLVQVQLDANTAINASASKTWTASTYLRLVGGSLANVSSVGVGVTYRDAGGAGLASGATSYAVSGGALRTQRATHASTSPASTAYAQATINISVASGAAIDITLRIGAPQIEQKAFASSYIPTASAAVLRAPDALTLSDLTRIGYNASAGALVVQGVFPALPADRYPTIVMFGRGVALADENGIVGVTTSRQISALTRIGGTTHSSPTPTGTYTAGAVYRAAYAWADQDRVAVLGGGAPAVATGAIPANLDRMSVGSNHATGGGGALAQRISRLKYYPHRLSNAELQSITT